MKNILKYVVVSLLLAGVHSGYAGQFLQVEEEFLQEIQADGYQPNFIDLALNSGTLYNSIMLGGDKKWDNWLNDKREMVDGADDDQETIRQVIQDVCNQVQQDKSKPDIRVFLLMEVTSKLCEKHGSITQEDQKFLREYAPSRDFSVELFFLLESQIVHDRDLKKLLLHHFHQSLHLQKMLLLGQDGYGRFFQE